MPIYLNMPVGDCYGWAICGKNLLKELSKLTEVRYCEEAFSVAFRDKNTADLVEKCGRRLLGDVKYPFIHTITGDCKPYVAYRGQPNIGYMFYEQEEIPMEYVESLIRNFDIVVGGSQWNEDVLRENGVKNAVHIVQGVDRELFYPKPKTEKLDKFVIFSGGKYEHRKGQAIVIEAASHMQNKYKDVVLVASWANLFDSKIMEECKTYVNAFLDPKRTIMLPILPQSNMVDVMCQTDIGVFPNIAEGGTNLALMEYMACGRPVIATNSTGHKDVLERHYSYFIDEKDLLNSTIANLEYAYSHREDLETMGASASNAMNKFSWEQTAKEFYRLANGL